MGIKRVDNSSPILPKQSLVTKDIVASDKVVRSNLGTSKHPTQLVDPFQHPFVFSGISLLDGQAEILRNFILWQEAKLEGDLRKRYTNMVIGNDTLTGTIEDLLSIFSKNNLDLMPVLKDMLEKSTDLEEKTVIAKMLYSLDQEDDFLLAFLIPSLEKRTKFENIEKNQEFAIQFLLHLDESDLQRIIRIMDFSSITNTANFAESLLSIADPSVVLEALIERCKASNSDEVSPRQITEQTNVQQIALEMIKKLEGEIKNKPNEDAKDKTKESTKDKPEENAVEPLPATFSKILETLYKTSINPDIRQTSAEIMARQFPNKARELFQEQMLNKKENPTNKERARRFAAIYHYSAVNKEWAVSVLNSPLKEIIEKEDDPMIIGMACFCLANYCGNDGKGALVRLIIKQIKEGKPSRALGILNLLVMENEAYLGCLKKIFSYKYPEENGLQQAYENIVEIPLCSVSKSLDNTVSFHYDHIEYPNLAVDFVLKIGLSKIALWATDGEGNTKEKKNIFKTNILDVLETAMKQNKNRMNNALLSTLANGSESSVPAIFLKELIGR